MQAIASGAQAIMLGEADVVLAGGIESMSRMPYLVDAEDARWGHRMGNFTLVDAMYRDGFTVLAVRYDHGRDGGSAGARSTASRAKHRTRYALESQRRRAAQRSPRPLRATRSRR